MAKEMNPNAEPEILPFAGCDGSDWTQIVDFMRDNPKLLMQMIPSNSEPEEPMPKETPSEAAIKKTRINDKLAEAQQWKQE